MYVPRVMELLKRRMSRIDCSGLSPGDGDCVGRFYGFDFEPASGTSNIGRAFPYLAKVEPAVNTAKTQIEVAAGFTYSRDNLEQSIEFAYRLTSPDNPFGIFRMLTCSSLKGGPYPEDGSWPSVKDPKTDMPIPGSDSWQWDAYSPGADVPAPGPTDTPHPIDAENAGYRYSVNMTQLGLFQAEDNANTSAVFLQALLEISAKPIGRKNNL